jgi:Lsr2
MATKVFRTDDLNGELIEDDVKPVTFTIEGAAYEIDLTEANRKVLVDFLSTYTAAGRPWSGRTKGGRRRNAADHGGTAGQAASAGPVGGAATTGLSINGGPVNPVAVRAWAAENWPEPVADKGRVPAAVVAAYEAAQLALQIAPAGLPAGPVTGTATTEPTTEEPPIAPVDPSQIPAPEGIFAVPDPA